MARSSPLPQRPRLLRAVLLQLAVIACVVLAVAALQRAPSSSALPDVPKPKPPQRLVRVIRLPDPAPPKRPPEPTPTPVAQKAPAPKPPPTPLARAQPAPPRSAPPRPLPPSPAPAPSSPAPSLAAEQTSVKGVPLRVMIPSDPRAIEAHLSRSGGCLVVSRLRGEEAEPLATFTVQGGRAVPTEGPPCGGVPRLLSGDSLNEALGDPIGHAARASGETGPLVLQIVLSSSLHGAAQVALAARFGPLPQEQMAQAAAGVGYELRCYAEPSGEVRCQ